MGLLAMIGLCAGAGEALAEPFVEHLSPPVLTRGKTARVTLVGSELVGATGIWTSLSPREVAATLVAPSEEERASFDVAVRANAPLGLYGLRLATRDGLSNVKLFLIDDLPVEAEGQPHAGSPRTQPLAWPVAVAGTMSEAEVDRYGIQVGAGERLSFEVVGSRLGQDFDPVITIRDARGHLIVERDNDVGLFFDCRFAHRFENAGRYTIEVQDTRFKGSDHIAYVLRVARFPEGRVACPSTIRLGDAIEVAVPGCDAFVQRISVPSETAAGGYFQELRRAGDQASAWVPLEVSPYPNILEHEPDDAPASATAAAVPSVVHGAIATPEDRDAFAVELAAGQRLSARFECRPLGSPADLDISLFDPSGKTVKQLDTLPDGAATVEIQAASRGRYVLVVKSLTGEGGPEYVYRITLALREPSVGLVSGVSGLAIPRGSYQPLPLALKRTDFGGPIALDLRGAPRGMVVRTALIAAGETEVDNAIVVADSVPEGLYSVQVMARIQAGGRQRTTTATTLPLIDRLPSGRGPHGEPFELREDQRRLPPSLTDRIAILVTPPWPYTFELPDRLVTLPRYLETTFRLETTRAPGFDAPITFVARGGTLEPLRLQKPRVKAEMPPATRDRPTVAGMLRSGVNSELRRHRVVVTAHSSHQGRAIDLTRTFELKVQVAYEPSGQQQRVEVRAGESASVSIHANRLAPFVGPIAIRPSGDAGLILPALVLIPERVDHATMKIAVPPSTKPGVHHVALRGSARVSKFDEVVAGKPIEVVVVAPKGGGS
jgi:hypothetical protein